MNGEKPWAHLAWDRVNKPTTGREKSWLYTLPFDCFHASKIKPSQVHEFADQSGVVRMTLGPSGVIRVLAGYTWNGASHWPDHPRLWRATLFHDALCQALDCPCAPFSWDDAATVFGDIAREDGYRLAGLVEWGVRWIGGFLERIGTSDDFPTFKCLSCQNKH